MTVVTPALFPRRHPNPPAAVTTEAAAEAVEVTRTVIFQWKIRGKTVPPPTQSQGAERTQERVLTPVLSLPILGRVPLPTLALQILQLSLRTICVIS